MPTFLASFSLHACLHLRSRDLHMNEWKAESKTTPLGLHTAKICSEPPSLAVMSLEEAPKENKMRPAKVQVFKPKGGLTVTHE